MDVADRLEELSGLYDLPAHAADRLGRLLGLVAAAPISITSVRSVDEAVEVHVADSLTGLLVPALRDAGSVADLGSGGGFPGLVLAVALPRAKVTLVESVVKKAAFMERAAHELGLRNVATLPVRAEDWAAGGGTQDIVTARALAPLATLVEYAAPLLSDEGTLVAWKGPGGDSEEAGGRAAAEVLGMSPPELLEVPRSSVRGGGERRLYVSSKVSRTPTGYPRRAGMARKRPIRASTEA